MLNKYCFIAITVTMLVLTGCTDSSGIDGIINEKVDISETFITEVVPESNAVTYSVDQFSFQEEKDEDNFPHIDDPEVDIDLYTLSSNMAYAEATNIVMTPEKYEGKTIRVYGQFFSTYWNSTEKSYYYIGLNDQQACCQQALEFIWDDNSHAWPDDYPESDSMIEIQGVIRIYEELGQHIAYIETDDIISQV